MTVSLLDQVRARCREVAEMARQVNIDKGAIASYAATLPPERLTLPEMDPAIHYLDRGAGTVAFLLTLDTINFGSGFFPEVFADPRQSGYRHVAARLNERFLQSGPLPAETLQHLTVAECADMLAIEIDSAAGRELCLLYAQALNGLGSLVCRSYQGEFMRLVERAGRSAGRIVELLIEMPFFDDRAVYNGVVPFFKRAQLAAADLFIAFDGSGPGAFDDLDSLTICADNLVPHVLRLDGILQYQATLAARIDSGEPLAAGSPEEVEIRACAVHAGELIVARLNANGLRANAMLLDNLLWHRGQQPIYRAQPRHRTKSCYY